MVVTYYVRFFRTGVDRHSGILMSLLLLVTETIKCFFNRKSLVWWIITAFRWQKDLSFWHRASTSTAFCIFLLPTLSSNQLGSIFSFPSNIHKIFAVVNVDEEEDVENEDAEDEEDVLPTHANHCESPKTMQKLCLSAKFPHQEIR